jgi:hypothetical protein
MPNPAAAAPAQKHHRHGDQGAAADHGTNPAAQ